MRGTSAFLIQIYFIAAARLGNCMQQLAARTQRLDKTPCPGEGEVTFISKQVFEARFRFRPSKPYSIVTALPSHQRVLVTSSYSNIVHAPENNNWLRLGPVSIAASANIGQL